MEGKSKNDIKVEIKKTFDLRGFKKQLALRILPGVSQKGSDSAVEKIKNNIWQPVVFALRFLTHIERKLQRMFPELRFSHEVPSAIQPQNFSNFVEKVSREQKLFTSVNLTNGQTTPV